MEYNTYIVIGFYKNDLNSKCFIDSLSYDLIKHIIKFIGIPPNKNTNGIFQLEI